MIHDLSIRLAASDAVPDGGAGGIGQTSFTLALQPGAIVEALENNVNIGSGQRLVLAINVDETFAGPAGAYCALQLVSLPVTGAALESATPGRKMAKDNVATDNTTDLLTLTGHGLAVGTPLHLTNIVTTTGISTGTVYYAVPTSADAFKLATSLANARAGTPVVNLGTGIGSVTVNYFPTIHASTGRLPVFASNTPLIAGQRLIVPLNAYPGQTVVQVAQYSGGPKLPLGAGPVEGLIGMIPQRHYYLHFEASATLTAGKVTAHLALETTDAKQFPRTSVEVIG